jgi:hypothetical protein
VRDVQTFVDHLASAYGIAVEDVAVVAQSVGAVAVATWVHDYAPRLRAMVLASPAFRVKLYVPLALPGLRLLRKVRPGASVTSYVKARFLTRDPARIASYDTDPLIAKRISVDVLLGLQEAADRVVDDAAAIAVPTQLLVSGADWVVHHAPQHAFFDRLGAPVKERHVLHGFLHDTLGERDRARAVELARDFLGRAFERAPAAPDLEADRRGPTREEADALAAPLAWHAPRAWYWAATRASLRLGAALADGVRIGRATGFDSGASLDYVYRDRAGGRTPLGRMIDRHYLDAVGWRGVRQRKLDLEALVREAAARLRAAGAPVHVLDIAAGAGRYVLDAFAGGPPPDAIVLRDLDEGNVDAGRAMLAASGLGDRARFERGDAFDRDGLAAVRPRPTLAIVSGLYELVDANAPVRRSLGGLADALAPGSYLVYTGQPWHPQLELIARALTSHRGGAWVMRRRSQAELDGLVAAAGFRKVAQRIGESGIFTVSLAQRAAP